MISDSLLNGVAVVIDNELNRGSLDPINDIAEQIKNKHIPILAYDELPPQEEIKHFSNASFILIDWKLLPDAPDEEILSGVSIGEAQKKASFEEIAKFILRLREHYFGPVFIFSQEDEGEIKTTLQETFRKEGESDCKDMLSYIFIKNKNELTGGKLFKTIDSWFEEKPSIYVIKKWDSIVSRSKNDLFWHLYSLNHNWPTVFWNIFKDDGTNPSQEIGNLLSKNFIARIEEYELDEESIIKEGEKPCPEDIRKLLSGERYIPDHQLSKDRIHCGDLFYYIDNKMYYINIRPECDCIPRSGTKIDDISLYLLKGEKIEHDDEYKVFNDEFNNFKEKGNCIIIPFIECDGDIILIRFKMRDLKIKKYKQCKNYRIGRLLPPYITQIRLKYSGYLQREGLTPTPVDAIFKQTTDQTENETAKETKKVDENAQNIESEQLEGRGTVTESG